MLLVAFLSVIVAIFLIYSFPTKFTGFVVSGPGPGENQTTIMLQEVDSENLKDSYVSGTGGEVNNNFGSDISLKTGNLARIYISFNLSFVPTNQNINNSKLCVYVTSTKKNTKNKCKPCLF